MLKELIRRSSDGRDNVGIQHRSLGVIGGLWPALLAVGLVVTWSVGLGQEVTLVEDGEAKMSIVSGSVQGPEGPAGRGAASGGEMIFDPVSRLQEIIEEISGARLAVTAPAEGAEGIYVGLVSDFPWIELDGVDEMGPEEFIIRTDGTNLYLLSGGELGVQHAVTTFLHRLGARWFFPGETWEVIPEKETIAGEWDEHREPAFRMQRRLWYGHGAYSQQFRDFIEWVGNNRTGGPGPVSIGHTWYGLDREKDFEEHPEWFALVEKDGEMRRRNSKPCYSHPEVIERMIQHARKSAEAGAYSVSLSPPDGLNYCECDRCKAVAQGGEWKRAHGTMFAERPDGTLVNITSETLFAAVNQVAEALEDDHPDFVIGCYAYSAYSHPPSFDMHPSVYIQTSTSYRRTPLSMEEQLQQWGQRASDIGIRGYWSVYQWDWDNPQPGRVKPQDLQEQIQFFTQNNVTALNTEMSNNWAPRGLGYYLGAHLLWEPHAELGGLIGDFYEKAFGPAAPVMQRYYARWYGPPVAVLETKTELPEAGVYKKGDLQGSRQTLREMFEDLDAALELTTTGSGHQDRIDHLRMYAYYLWLRLNYWEASAANDDDQAILDAIRDETVFKGRLADTNMVHTRALLLKRFERKFSKHKDLFEDLPEAQRGGEWRQTGEPPSRRELDRLWSRAKAELGLK